MTEASSWGERTAGDFSSLLVELARAIKGLRFYEEGHDARRDILDRAFLAWRVELDRSGTVDLHVDDHFFRCSGVSERLVHGQLCELADLLRHRGLARLRITPVLTRSAFHSLAELLALDAITIDNRRGFANALAERESTGIQIGKRDGVVAELEPEVEVVDDGQDVAPIRTESPSPSASPEPAAASTFIEADSEGPAGSHASLGSSLLGSSRTAVEEFEDFTKPSLEENPLEAAVSNERDEELRSLLRELDGCADDESYSDLASHVSGEAIALADQGMVNACYRVILVLADHAVGHGGRSGVQLRTAQTSLEELCVETRLDELIDRACDPEGTVSVRAAQVLLQLGGRAVPPLLERLEAERDRSRAAQISAIVIALGERAVPILVAEIRSPEPTRARMAVRLAGELQSPNLIQTLRAVLEGKADQVDLDLRREAAHALVHIGGSAARETLVAALQSPVAGLPGIAIASLGTLGDSAATPALVEQLGRAMKHWRDGTAREIIRALASLGCPAAVPKLVEILERRSWTRRREQHEARIAALGALGQLPGDEALAALERAQQHRDPQIRQMATRSIARRK